MKKNLHNLYWRTVLICALFLGVNSNSYASHAMGADLTYTCVGPNQYEITLRVFRDCNGISMPTSFAVSYSGCGSSGSVAVSLQSSSDITPLCPSQTSRCSGGSSSVGVEEYLYQGTVTVPPNCANITFSASTCCRNGIITNILAPNTNDFYIRSQLNNNLSACNSSPQFASSPTPFTCVNQPIVYPQLANDPDGDVLVYSLTDCLQGSGSSVTYNGGFSGTNPLTVPVTINPTTGEMSFTANTPQVAAICVLVEEFRGGVKVGEIVRDMQFVIQNCTNQLPTLSGIDNAPGVFDITVCEGSSFCFDIDGDDVNAGDNLSMSFIGSLSGSTFTQSGSGNNLTGTFCWTPPIGSAGTHVFSILVSDDACPIPGQNSRAYTINVIPNPNPPVTASADVGICDGESTVLTATTAAGNIASFLWSPAVGLSSTTGTPAAGSPNSTTASPNATTNYTVTLNYTDGCSSTDDVTVTINPDPVANISPSAGSVCPGGNFQLTGNTDATGMTFQWFNPSMGSLGSGVVSGPTSTIVVTVPGTPGSYVYTLRVTNPISGCITEATATLEVGAPPVLPSCVNIYASPSGSAAAAGTQANPTSLAEALSRGACQNSVIKLATGTYNISNPLTIPSLVTIEGGFNPITWVKTSLPGATVINRTTANPEGAAGARRLVAFYGNSVTGFRFQDVTITTSNANQSGMSTYGLHLTNCSGYNIVRTQILPGNGGNGLAGINGTNGGNGSNGGYGGAGRDRCNSGCDAGGAGGNGGAGGAAGTGAATGTAGGAGGRGGNGANDCSTNAQNGTGTSCAGGGSGCCGHGDNGATCNSAGANGTNGVNGTAAIGTFFTPANGTNGTAGTGGRGGGGGGGGAEHTSGCNASGNGGSGGGGGGGGGGAGGRGTGGGASFAVFALSNGAGAQIIDSRLIGGTAGAAGIGGNGGNGGARGNGGATQTSCNGCGDVYRGGAGGAGSAGGNGGRGGNGSAGISVGFRLTGTSPTIINNGSSSSLGSGNNNPTIFNLAGQATITVSNVNCTNTNVNYTTSSASTWDFDRVTNNATPATSGVSSNTNTQYSQIARYTVSRGANIYTGFHNVSFDGSILPDIATNANPLGVDTFQLCAGDFAVFESIYYGESYQWNFNGAIANPGPTVQVTPSTQFNTPGFYPVTLNLITDCCGLSPTRTIYLYVDVLPTATIAGGGAICPGEERTITLTGLAASDSVIWSPTTNIVASTANSITVSPTSTTTYTASIYTQTTVNGEARLSCPLNRSQTVTVNAEPTMSLALTQPSCNNNGQIVANITSGGGSYNFVWSNGPTTFNATSSTNGSIGTGTYSVTATNVFTGCTVTESTLLYPAPASPVVYLETSTPTTCGANNGTATVNTVGGSGVFTYAWSSGGLATSSRTNLAAGNYCVTATDVFSSCRSTVCFDITDPGTVMINILSTSNPSCPGDNGTATVEAVGGRGVITYLWSNGETTATATALPAGTSNVTATDDDGCQASVAIVLSPTNTLSTAPTITPIIGSVCPNTNVTVTAGGGTAGSGSNISWYDGPNGTGTFLGTGASITFAPASTTTVYARREGICNTTGDDASTITVKTYIYAPNNANTSTYCTDNFGWQHFFIGDDIIFSVRGDLTNAPAGFPIATILDNGAYYQTGTGPFTTASCPSGLTPGEEWFEMERSWNLDMGGGAPIGAYDIRFYYEPAERTAIESAAAAWMAANPTCGYSYKYPYPLGFYWFKDVANPYVAPTYNGTHYNAGATIGTTVNSINYSEWVGIPSFSGGGGAVQLVPDILLPVDWMYFTGVTDGRVNYLDWATAREEHTAYFDVERSQDGITFEKIGKVDAQGNSQITNYYTFEDQTPFTGLNYYRLRLFDLNGQSSLSNVVVLDLGKEDKGYVFYPNPTDNIVSYQFSTDIEDEIQIEVLDVLGRSLQTTKFKASIGTNRLKINLKDYPEASYLVRATHLKTGAVHTDKIIKKSN